MILSLKKIAKNIKKDYGKHIKIKPCVAVAFHSLVGNIKPMNPLSFGYHLTLLSQSHDNIITDTMQN
jgi:hypothetical protein